MRVLHTGPLLLSAISVGHPRLCQALDDPPQAADTALLCGVDEVTVVAGAPPKVAFTHMEQRHRLASRLVICADGCGSTETNQVEEKAEADPVHHVFSGMLVEGAGAGQEEEFTVRNEGDLLFFVLLQGGGRLRRYASHGLDQPGHVGLPERKHPGGRARGAWSRRRNSQA